MGAGGVGQQKENVVFVFTRIHCIISLGKKFGGINNNIIWLETIKKKKKEQEILSLDFGIGFGICLETWI